MDWDAIRYYLALVESPTLIDAAAALSVSDATVMRRVQSLETSLRTTLFVRTRKGHQLTPSGERFLAAAREMENLANLIWHDLAGEDDALTGSVIIATTEFGADHILGPALPEFRKQYPNLVLTLNVSPADFDLTQPQAGIALRFQRPEQGPYLISKIGNVSWGLYIAKAKAKELSLESGGMVKGNEPFIGWAPPVDNIRVARSLLRSFPKGSPAINVPTLRGQLSAVLSGFGVAHIPCALGDRDDALVRLKSREPEVVLEAWLVLPRQYRHLARVKAAAEFVRKAVSSF